MRSKTLAVLSACLLLLSAAGIPRPSVVYATPREEYEDAKKEADATKQRVETLAAEIETLNREIADEAARIEESRAVVAELETEIQETGSEVLNLEEQIQRDRDFFTEVVQMLYVAQIGENETAVLLRAENLFDIRNREEYEKAMSDYYDAKLTAYETRLADMEEQNTYLTELREAHEAELADYEERLAGFDRRLAALTSLMLEAKQEAEDAERFAEELENQMLLMEARERELLSQTAYTGVSSNVTYTGNGTNYYYENAYSYTDSELLLLAGIIEAEAGSTSYPGMLAVGSVVMNRVASPNFANTIEGVIYAPSQFEPAGTGRLAVILAKGPEASCVNVAREVLAGKRNVPNYYFKAAWYAEAHGISGVNIGGNVFH